MLANQELFSIIGIFVIVMDLIVTGIIGLIKREIYAKNIFVQILFLPLGLIGRIIGYFYGKMDNELDTGNAAISSSIATIALGLFISIIFGFYYLDTYKIIDYDVIKMIVPICLISLIIVIPVTIIFIINKSKKRIQN